MCSTHNSTSVFFVSAFLLLLATCLPAKSAAQVPESLEAFHLLYQQVLDDAVYSGTKNGVELNLVDYVSLQRDERLDWLMAFLAQYDYRQLESKEERIAHFLNAYNIMAINMVCENWPLKSLRSLGNMFKPVWTHSCGVLNEEPMTLRILEHEFLRAQDEPRIHFGLNCASVSCPDLRKEPYVGARLDEQLKDQTLTFFRQQGKGVKIDGNKIWLSPLMDWFEEDFETVGGVNAFLDEYLPSPPEGSDWELMGFLVYDWDVNRILTSSEKRRIKLRAR